MIRILIACLMIFPFTISARGLDLPACGEGSQDDRSLTWSELARLDIDSPFLKEKALLCLAASSEGKPMVVTYRDGMSSRVFKVSELLKGRQVLLHSDDIDIHLVRPGKLISLSIPSLRVDGDEEIFDLELRFVRNMSRLGKADMRAWQLTMGYNHHTGEVRSIGAFDFNHLDLNISATAVLKTIKLKDGEHVLATLHTDKMPEVKEL